MQGGAIRIWRQPRPLALRAELAGDRRVSAPALHGQRPRPGPAATRVAVLRLPDPRARGSLSQGVEILLSLPPGPIHAILIYIYRLH